MKRFAELAIGVACIVSCASFAQTSQSLEQMQRERAHRQAVETLESADRALTALSDKRESECMMATGSNQLCSCLNENLPVVWSFRDYVAITTRTKAENNYARLDPQMKSAYDNAVTVRNSCVIAQASSKR